MEPLTLEADRDHHDAWTLLQLLGLGALLAQLGAAELAPEPLLHHVSEPPYLATLSDMLVTLALVVLRFASPRRARLEQAILALFLAGMPVIYSWSTWLASPHDAPRLLTETFGVLIYCALAWLGFRGRPRLLALGIAWHGMGWDVWHFSGGRGVPGWYARGCLLADVCIGFYVMTQGSVYRARRARAR